MSTISAGATTQKTGRPFAIRAKRTAPKFRRTFFWLWIAGTLLWTVTCSVVIYDAYAEPYDLWLMLDRADVKYSECWPKMSGTDSIAQQAAPRNFGLYPEQPWLETRRHEAERLRQVTACYREFNRAHQLTTRYDVLKQGVLTMIGSCLSFLPAGYCAVSRPIRVVRTNDK